mgnify:CR=1 FL=1
MAVIKTVQEESLVALGDAIREKAGTSEPLIFPTGMIEAIEAIETGGGSIEVEPIVLTEDCQYACAGALASYYIKLFGNTITTNNITNNANMFDHFSGSSIPFEVNMKTAGTNSMNKMFNAATSLEELPKVNNAKPDNIGSMFQDCWKLRNIPEDWVDSWDFSALHNSSGACSYVFYDCFSLRKIPVNFLKNIWSAGTGASYVPYYCGWGFCYALDELIGVPVHQASLTSNRCVSTVNYCSRLKNFIFEVNEDGSPKTAKWKSQIIDLTLNVGYASSADYMLNYNSGITADKEVKDDATYQALKDDPDWFTAKVDYSRYNHDSAVATINSLPDCSATGTNTIKFKGASGSKTDGGAINTLTEEEIAVATAKGWTVTLS